jgi:HEPN domain-containing protein
MHPEALREAEAWLRKAESDLRAIRILMTDEAPPLDIVCFHAQQAAEKAVKAMLTAHGIAFPKTHDLALLASLAPERIAPDLPRETWAELSYFAVGPRYPDDFIEYTRSMADDLFAKARMAFDAVRVRLSEP